MGSSTPLFKPGELCGGYQILEFIARGGMAEVYRVVCPSTSEIMALKCVKLEQIADTYVKDHMIAEAELLSGLRHENVVRVDDVGIDQEVLWMAMEYLSGKTLRAVMHASPDPLPILTALYYAREIADGVTAAHEMRVVHRDLKPENVMITDEDKVKVLDMGAAKFFGWNIKTTLVGTIVGTPLYMAPEHIRGEPVDGRTDVYALGMILYEMLAGHHPLARSRNELPSKLEVCAMHIHASPPPLTSLIEGFPAYVWEVVKKAIAKAPNDRYSSMSEFAQAIRGAWKRFLVENRIRGAWPPAMEVRESSGSSAAAAGGPGPSTLHATSDDFDSAATIRINIDHSVLLPPEPGSARPGASNRPATSDIPPSRPAGRAPSPVSAPRSVIVNGAGSAEQARQAAHFAKPTKRGGGTVPLPGRVAEGPSNASASPMVGGHDRTKFELATLSSWSSTHSQELPGDVHSWSGILWSQPASSLTVLRRLYVTEGLLGMVLGASMLVLGLLVVVPLVAPRTGVWAQKSAFAASALETPESIAQPPPVNAEPVPEPVAAPLEERKATPDKKAAKAAGPALKKQPRLAAPACAANEPTCKPQGRAPGTVKPLLRGNDVGIQGQSQLSRNGATPPKGSR